MNYPDKASMGKEGKGQKNGNEKKFQVGSHGGIMKGMNGVKHLCFHQRLVRRVSNV